MEEPATAAPCWCEQFPPLDEIQPEQGCLCAACLRAALLRQSGHPDTA